MHERSFHFGKPEFRNLTEIPDSLEDIYLGTIQHVAPAWGAVSVPLWTEELDGRALDVVETWTNSETFAGLTDELVGLRNHSADLLLGRVAAKTMTSVSTAEGQEYSIHLVKTSAGRDTFLDVLAGNLQGSSFAFQIDEDEHQRFDFIDENGQLTDRKGAAAILRTVTGATKLIDQGPVVNPAYPIELKVKAIRSSEAWRRSVDVARRDRVFVSVERARVVAW